MNTLRTAPTRVGPEGDVARRLALWMGPAIRASESSQVHSKGYLERDGGTPGGALYLALGDAIAKTRAYTTRSLLEVFGHLAVDTLPDWERSLGLLSGEGSPREARQAAVRARWIAVNTGPSLLDVRRALRALAPEASVVEIRVPEVAGTDRQGVFRLAVLVSDVHEDDAQFRARISATLAPQVQAHVTWAIGRGAGPDIDDFLCDRLDSLVEIDLLSE